MVTNKINTKDWKFISDLTTRSSGIPEHIILYDPNVLEFQKESMQARRITTKSYVIAKVCKNI